MVGLLYIDVLLVMLIICVEDDAVVELVVAELVKEYTVDWVVDIVVVDGISKLKLETIPCV
jgi:hypothetical protein